MTFTTLTFVLFLGLVFAVYWTVRHRAAQNVVLILASYAFYSWWDYRFCALMLISSVVDYAAGIGLSRTDRPGVRRAWLGLSLAANLGMLGFFKYYNFFAESVQELARAMGVSMQPLTLYVVLPVGISFYTMQTLAYTIDVYRRRTPACHSAVDYFTYVSFFPQLVAGPIERAGHLLRQFATPRTFDYDDAAAGCRQILWGFTQKMLIADNLGPIVAAVYDEPDGVSGTLLGFGTVCLAFQFYCDFAGYSNIARGTAKLFGIELMRNFAYPFFSQSMGEFWRRWHISLSTWFRDYVYISLGGSRAGRGRMVANVLVTFFLSGLWHGASWNFILWGTLNGIGTLPDALRGGPSSKARGSATPGGERLFPAGGTLLRMGCTFAFFVFTIIFVGAKTLDDSVTIIGAIASDAFSGSAWSELSEWIFGDRARRLAVVFLLVFFAIEWVQRRYQHALERPPRQRYVRWTIYSVLIWAVLYWGTRTNAEFMYFQF